MTTVKHSGPQNTQLPVQGLANQERDSASFGRVAVVCGGPGSEREVSLESGQAVFQALQKKGVDAFICDGLEPLIAAAQANRVDTVFNILHGGAGENGVLPGLLDALQLPYTGCGVLGAALSMDKVRSKQLWQALQLPTTDFVVHQRGQVLDPEAIIARLGLPLMVKPVQEGSTVGASRVYQAEQLAAAITLAERYDNRVLVEPLIQGLDYTVAVLGEETLPSIRIEPASGFYDYHAKYVADDTRYICPGLEGEAEAEMQAIALAAFKALGCSGWGRVDFMRQDDGALFLLEVNTTPGMTSHSLVPMAAREVGMSFEELVWRILQNS